MDFCGGTGEFSFNAGDIDADGEGFDGDSSAVGVDAALGGFETEDANATADKVARVGVVLEADHVGAEHAHQYFLAFYKVSTENI